MMTGRRFSMFVRAAIAALALLSALVAGCGYRQQTWQLANAHGLLPALQFTLTQGDGRTVRAEEFRGKVTLLYFGYTHCPDECPTTLATLARAIKPLGVDADRIRVLFVTVDPKRDTAEALKQYTRLFGPEFVGLRGDAQQLQQLTRRYRVSYGLGPPDASGDYEVTHSNVIYVFDGAGDAVLVGSEADGVQAFVHDLKQLLAA
jgi:protein SCO1/2